MQNKEGQPTEESQILDSGKPERFSELELKKLGEEILELRSYIMRICQKFLGGGHSRNAEDLAQRTIIKAIDNLSQFEGHSALKSWLTRIAINEVKAYFREGTSKHEFLPGEEHDQEAAGLENTRMIALRDIDSKLSLIDAERGIEKLPLPEQDIIRMLVMGFTADEIARHLGIKLLAARTRIHRARASLKKNLGHGA